MLPGHNFTLLACMSRHGSGPQGRSIMVFHPTLAEMRDFSKYIEHMESQGAHHAGIAKVRPLVSLALPVGPTTPDDCIQSRVCMILVKVVPPSGFSLRDPDQKIDIKIGSPICQCIDGAGGVLMSHR